MSKARQDINEERRGRKKESKRGREEKRKRFDEQDKGIKRKTER